MSKLSFKLGFKSTEFNKLDLPVEVLKPNLAFVSRTLTSQAIDVKPGIYLVRAILPAGQELCTEVVVDDQKGEALLTPDPEQESPYGYHETHHFLSSAHSLSTAFYSARQIDDVVEALGVDSLKFEVRITFHHTHDPRKPSRDIHATKPNLIPIGSDVQFEYYSRNGTQYLEVLQPSRPATHVALPAYGNQSCLVVLKRLLSGRCAVDMHLSNKEADLLLRGLERGYLQQAVVVTTSDSLKAKKLVREKEGDPISAAVWAYALLQFGELDRLHDWTENLKNWFPWLPDGLAIRGEYLARVGKHKEALKAFVDLPMRGVPLFSTGLAYAIDRLKMYINVKNSSFSEEMLVRADTVLKDLLDLSTYVDFREAVLTTTGIPSIAIPIRIIYRIRHA